MSRTHGPDDALRLITGWGRTSATLGRVRPVGRPDDVTDALRDAGPRGVLARGLGRSYGDIAQNAAGLVLDMTRLGGVRHLDEGSGTVRVAAGTSLDRLLRHVVPRGWVPMVLPGTRWVTVGGAIANDVHGKNHHHDGGFTDHVLELTLVTADGEARTIGPERDVELFSATAGGLGLTGVITEATLRLLPITTSFVRVDTERAQDLDGLLRLMEDGDDRYRYSVAWVDGAARGRHLGRGILTRADHADLHDVAGTDRLAFGARSLGGVPPGVPRLVGRGSVTAFNELWFRRAPRDERGRIRSLASFFFPLDTLVGWNRLYGRRGLIQYQFAVPFGHERVLGRALELLHRCGCPSALTVLKRFGPGRGMLSFPIAGWTLAMDVPAAHPKVGRALDVLDETVARAGGRVYLAKDSRLRPELFGAMYPELERWRQVRADVDPDGALRSDLERRLLAEHERAEAAVA